MNTYRKSATNPRRIRRGLRLLAVAVSHPIWASYIPSGPGSLPTGQSAAAKHGAPVRIRESGCGWRLGMVAPGGVDYGTPIHPFA